MKIKQGIAAAIVAIGLGAVVAPGIAEAHTAAAYANCAEGLQITVGLYNNPTTTIKIDDVTTVRTGTGHFEYSLGDPTVPHTWSVVVVESDGSYRAPFDGTVPACTDTTTTTAAVTTTTAAVTTTTASGVTTTTASGVTTTTASGVTTTTAPGVTTTAGPTTTVGATTTTDLSTVGGRSGTVGQPVTTTTRPPAAALPATGTGSGPIAGVAAALLAAGGVLFAVSRRTRSATD